MDKTDEQNDMANNPTDTNLVDAGTVFNTLPDVLTYLELSGWKITRPSLYRHGKQGKLLPEKSGTYSQKKVDRYARTFLKQCATGKKIKENTDDLQRNILKQTIRLNDQKIKRLTRIDAIEASKYVSVKVVLSAASTMCGHTRTVMLNIPERLAAKLAAERDANKIREILTREIHRTLERLEAPGA